MRAKDGQVLRVFLIVLLVVVLVVALGPFLYLQIGFRLENWSVANQPKKDLSNDLSDFRTQLTEFGSAAETSAKFSQDIVKGAGGVGDGSTQNYVVISPDDPWFRGGVYVFSVDETTDSVVLHFFDARSASYGGLRNGETITKYVCAQATVWPRNERAVEFADADCPPSVKTSVEEDADEWILLNLDDLSLSKPSPMPATV